MSLISNVLIPIIKLWLRSQTEQLGSIGIDIGGSSWQILQGEIPYAKVVVESVIYQGIHISKASLQAEQIKLNVPELIKGKPLELLDPIQVQMFAFLDQQAVNSSLQSDLYRQTINNLQIPHCQPRNDQELTYYLEVLIQSLGEQFQLQVLTVEKGAVTCQGIFPIHAT